MHILQHLNVSWNYVLSLRVLDSQPWLNDRIQVPSYKEYCCDNILNYSSEVFLKNRRVFHVTYFKLLY